MGLESGIFYFLTLISESIFQTSQQINNVSCQHSGVNDLTYEDIVTIDFC